MLLTVGEMPILQSAQYKLGDLAHQERFYSTNNREIDISLSSCVSFELSIKLLLILFFVILPTVHSCHPAQPFCISHKHFL